LSGRERIVYAPILKNIDKFGLFGTTCLIARVQAASEHSTAAENSYASATTIPKKTRYPEGHF
jgi:hypothetical protein